MTANRFGGVWTADKLAVLRKYLDFYTRALRDKPTPQRPFQLVYIDAFAGTGRCHVGDGTAQGRVIDGSALIALDNSYPFARYHFIEPKRAHRLELEQLIASHPRGALARVTKARADDVLPYILQGYDWRRTRGVLFLDPFGLHCSWQMLSRVRATEALDVFYLLNLAGLFRQAALRLDAIPAGTARRLDSVLGSTQWRQALYVVEQGDFFDDPAVSRQGGWQALLDFTAGRLRSLFPYVGEPRLLYGPTRAPLFALFFMVANPDPKAVALAGRVSREILGDLR